MNSNRIEKPLPSLKRLSTTPKWRIHQATTSVPVWCNFLSPFLPFLLFVFILPSNPKVLLYFIFYSQLQRTRGSLKRCTRYSRFNFSGSNNFDPASSTIFLDVLNPSMRPISRVPTHAQAFSASFGVSVEVCDWLWSTNHTNKPTYNPYQLRKVIDEIDRRFALIPPFDGLIIFPNGISKITIQNKGKFQGKEYRNVMKVSTSPPKNMN